MPHDKSLEISVITPDGLLFQGKAHSVTFPGEKGVFEVLPQHKPLLSRLIRGMIVIDSRAIAVRRGIVKLGLNKLIAIVETPQST